MVHNWGTPAHFLEEIPRAAEASNHTFANNINLFSHASEDYKSEIMVLGGPQSFQMV